jgi:hypothetical protein
MGISFLFNLVVVLKMEVFLSFNCAAFAQRGDGTSDMGRPQDFQGRDYKGGRSQYIPPIRAVRGLGTILSACLLAG